MPYQFLVPIEYFVPISFSCHVGHGIFLMPSFSCHVRLMPYEDFFLMPCKARIRNKFIDLLFDIKIHRQAAMVEHNG